MTDKPVRVLHVLPHLRSSGNGIVNVGTDLAIGQVSLGYEVYVASDEGGYKHLLDESGVGWIHIKLTRSISGLAAAALALHRAIEAYRIEIVHAHTPLALLLVWLIRGRRRFRIVATAHTAFRRESLLLSLADRVIAVSAADRTSLLRRRIAVDRIDIIVNGAIGSTRDSIPFTATLQHPAIVTVAGLYFRKGIDVLIKSFNMISSHFPLATLYVVGEGPDREAFERQAASLPCASRIVFFGFRNDARAIMSSADIFILASRQEPLGLVLIEARLANCAIIGSDAGGIPEALDHGKAGLIVKAGDAKSLASALEDILRSPELLADLKRRAAIGLDKFTVARMAHETAQIYDTVRSARHTVR